MLPLHQGVVNMGHAVWQGLRGVQAEVLEE